MQGVGFRPFVHRLATELRLTGYVANTPQGVQLEVEGEQPLVTQFFERFESEKPPLALISSLEAVWLPPCGYRAFTIRSSEVRGERLALILPDIATCPDCLRDIFDPHNRRYRYPFTNCTHCGPRLSILLALPYDRPHTTMHTFPLCPACQAEYDNPHDRRFHAQPIACPICGPQLHQWGKSQSPEPHDTSQGTWVVEHSGAEALHQTIMALRRGCIVAVKGLGGFHLMVDASQGEAIARLRERKPRPDKPLALMVRDLAQAHQLCVIPPQAEDLLTSPESPIVLLRKREARETSTSSPSSHPSMATGAVKGVTVAENVAPGINDLGIMLPYTPLHHLLMRELPGPVVATSGNVRDEPMCFEDHDAIHRLGHVADLFLTHNRPIARHVDDSVAWIIDGAPQVLRRARGYAPLPIFVPNLAQVVLGVGAQLKNAIALSVPHALPQPSATTPSPTPIFLSQHIGDLETPEARAAFERVVADFLRLYDVTPAIVAHDLHPDYYTTSRAEAWAAAHGWKLQGVQHHHAHLAACLADAGCAQDLTTMVLGVVWDGTGYGPDGTVWGGEWLLGNAAAVTRVAHLRPFLLPGGEAAIREPRRIALALLWELVGDEALEYHDLPSIQSFTSAERRVLKGMLQRRINTPSTTSAGRLFDGIAALIGLHQRVTYEGQAAIALEHACHPIPAGSYPFDIEVEPPPKGAGEVLVFDWRPMVAGVLQDLRRGEELAIMASRVHQTLIEAIVRITRSIASPAVALSGGCFQNRILTEGAVQRLREIGVTVLLHRQIPPNDGGISLGQVVVAAAQQSLGGAANHGVRAQGSDAESERIPDRERN